MEIPGLRRRLARDGTNLVPRLEQAVALQSYGMEGISGATKGCWIIHCGIHSSLRREADRTSDPPDGKFESTKRGVTACELVTPMPDN